MDPETELTHALTSDSREERTRAFEAVYARHRGCVHALALNITGRAELADEVTQETFLQVYRHAGGFRGDTRLRGWILRIAANLARRVVVREHMRRERVRERFSRDEPLTAPGPDARLERTEDLQAVRDALESLEPEHRIAVSLSCIEGLSTAEIAAIMGCPPGTVWSRIHHAKRKLAEKIRHLGGKRPEKGN